MGSNKQPKLNLKKGSYDKLILKKVYKKKVIKFNLKKLCKKRTWKRYRKKRKGMKLNFKKRKVLKMRPQITLSSSHRAQRTWCAANGTWVRSWPSTWAPPSTWTSPTMGIRCPGLTCCSGPPSPSNISFRPRRRWVKIIRKKTLNH